MEGFLENAEVEEVDCFQRVGHDLVGERLHHQFDVNLIYDTALGQNEELVKECFDDLALVFDYPEVVDIDLVLVLVLYPHLYVVQ